MKPLVLALAAAIGLCRPSMEQGKRVAYAAILADHSQPFLIVALIEHESRWLETAISKDKKDYGLGQIRRKFIPRVEWKWLLDGRFNLKKTIWAIEWWRKTCKLKLGSDSAMATLEGYAGRSHLKTGSWCGAGLPPLKSTKWILAREKALRQISP